jgi:UDP-N-acetylglucosamine 2-epimerase (non-hydrolysing)
MKIISVVGARPNFMKIAPFIRAVVAHNRKSHSRIEHILVHTGQHYDDKMSKSFFEALDIPDADINLGVGSGTHAEQVGHTMMEFEKVLRTEKPDWVVVVGDVNATLACSVTAKKEWVKCCHIEAGLRSGDMTMPEEINRLVTDRLSDLLLTPDELSSDNLRKEGVPEERIKFVGNIMIDTLETQLGKAEQLSMDKIIRENALPEQSLSPSLFSIANATFAVMTMHRPSNVDQKEVLEPILDFLINDVAQNMPLFWPMHPRARKKIEDFGLWQRALDCPNLILMHPLGYHQLLRLNMDARIMLTDSGGLQEECCVLGTPCLTLRWNTERPVTLKEHGGASVLVGNDVKLIRKEYQKTLVQKRRPVRPKLWDGRTAERCLEAILATSTC